MVKKLKAILSLALIAILALGTLGITALAADPTKIAIVGDDVIGGYGLTDAASQSAAAVIADTVDSNYDVENFTVNDATILREGMAPTDTETKTLAAAYVNSQNYEESLAYQPDIVLISLGTNDAKTVNMENIADVQGDLESLIDRYQRLASRPKVVVATPLAVDGETTYGINQANIDQVVAAIEAAAENMGCMVLDMQAFTTQLAGQYLSEDPVHLSVLGHITLGEYLAEVLTSTDVQNMPDREINVELRV